MTAPHCNEAETLPDNLTLRAADMQADVLRFTRQTLEACADMYSDDPPPDVECFKRLILARRPTWNSVGSWRTSEANGSLTSGERSWRRAASRPRRLKT